MKPLTIKYLLLIISFVMSGKIYSQQGWEYVNPYPTGQTIWSMSFINANTGIAVTSYGGTVLNTTNGGMNWTSRAPYPLSVDFFGCLMIDENTWLAGRVSDYTAVGIFRTTDRGLNWHEIYNTGLNGSIDNFYRYNENTIYALHKFAYLKSTDRGNTWTRKEVSSYPNYLNSIMFLNDSIGYIGSQDSIILKTTNYGENWFGINVHPVSPFTYFSSVMFKNENTGICVSSEAKGSYRTTNGGINWTHYPNQSGRGTFYGDFINIQNYYSTDFGLTWIQRNAVDSLGYFITFADSNTCYSTYVEGNHIWKSTNKGVNFSKISRNYFPESKDFTICNRNKLFVITRQQIFRSTNFGDDFQQVYSNNQYYLSFIDFSDSLKGIAVGSEGKILLTTNGGNTWLPKTVGSSGKLGVNYMNNKIVIQDSAINKIYISENSGATWDSVQINNDVPKTMKFVNENTGYMSSIYTYPKTALYKTTNGGYNWQFIKNISTTFIEFNNNDIGIVSALPFYFRTTNGGISWDSLTYPYAPSGFYALSAKYVSPQTVYVTGLYGRIFKSTDGGVNWQEQKAYSGLQNSLTKIDFFDTVYGMAHRQEGVLLRTKTGGEINVGIKQISNEVPEGFYLGQNYPNPFNSITSVKFQIINSGIVVLKVFDILGREVKTLVNEYKQPGTYQVSFYAEGLSSGIYFYRIETNNFISTKKCVLLK